MVLDFQWLRSILASATWAQVSALVSAGVVGQLLWSHYGILLNRRLPPHDLGAPLRGHTLEIFKQSFDAWAARMMAGRKVLLSHYFSSHVILVRHEVYMEHINRAERNGKLCPLLPPSVQRLNGEHSVINLPGGKGHQKHHRLRQKILSSLGPKYVLSLILGCPVVPLFPFW
ncbi:BA13 [Symbiodinium natans]|uniref:BA13 protein n=1 Tax=Symbiodinium natans TaxID=878477 RepID=A0A812GWZ1_9DINO|nr:BA13 [Symbiodinium natans]